MGYFVDNRNRGAFLNSVGTSGPITLEKFFNIPFNNFFPKFYELIPAIVIGINYKDADGKITVEKLIENDDGSNKVDAYPLNVFVKTYPREGDHVLLAEYNVNLNKYNSNKTNRPPSGMSRNINKLGSGVKSSIYYYISILNVNLSPTNYKNLYPITNDVIFQGNYGQSIRFSSSISRGSNAKGNIYNSNILGNNSTNSSVTEKMKARDSWIYGEAHNQPLIIISNGRNLNGDDSTNTIENINLDYSSIYLTSDNKIPLKISQRESSYFNNERSNEYTKKTTPIKDNFDGPQIILTSNNLVFKSRKNTCVYSNQNIAFNASESIVLTSGNNIVLEPLNNGYIYLGADAVQNGEPAAKAESLIKILQDIIFMLREGFVHKSELINHFLQTQAEKLQDIKSSNTYIL